MNRTKIVIIGGIAAGASAAGKAARTDPNAEITLVEKGPHISVASCGFPYFIGGEVNNRGRLIIRKPEDFKNRYGVRVLVNTEALSINRPQKTVTLRSAFNSGPFELEYDKLIIATGSIPFIPPVPGAESPNVFGMKTVEDTDRLDSFITENRPVRAAVIGAGYIGVEAADALIKRGIKTALIELTENVLPQLDKDMAEIMEKAMTKAGLELYTGRKVKAIKRNNDGFATGLITECGMEIETDLILMSAGVRPNTALARKAGLDMGKTAILTDEYMRTSDSDIYAAGDAVEVKNLVTGHTAWAPLAGPANLQGKVAGANAAGGSLRFKGVLGTSIVLFDRMTAAKTGLGEKDASREGLDYFTVSIKSSSHAGYYPGAVPLYIKGLFRKNTAVIIGAQVLGEKGADKRIDVLSTAIYSKLTATDLENLDLAYSPPFSLSLDPVNVLGAQASEKMKKITDR